MAASPISSSIDVDVSPAAVAARIARRRLALQDRALELREGGMKPMPLGEALGVDKRHALALAHVASTRRRTLDGVVPHPDPESFELTDPERLLLRSVLEVHIENWLETEASGPDTGWVGRRVHRSSQWAVSCARRRLARNYCDPNPVALFDCSGNGYISLTELGWSLAVALHPAIAATVLPDLPLAA